LGVRDDDVRSPVEADLHEGLQRTTHRRLDLPEFTHGGRTRGRGEVGEADAETDCIETLGVDLSLVRNSKTYGQSGALRGPRQVHEGLHIAATAQRRQEQTGGAFRSR